MRTLLLLTLLFTLPTLGWSENPPSSKTPAPWARIAGVPQEEPFVAVAVAVDDANVIAAATSTSLYVSQDRGKTWSPRRMLPANAVPTAIAIQSNPRVTLIATNQGLYADADDQGRWTLAFKGIGDAVNASTFVAFLPKAAGHALLGTRNGLFLSDNGGREWRELAIPIDARDVVHAAVDPTGGGSIYVISARGCFIGNLNGEGWRQILTTRHAEEMAGEGSEIEQAGEETDHLPILRAVAVDPSDAGTALVGTAYGVVMSTNQGLSWSALSSTGLGSTAVSRLIAVRQSPLIVYAAANRSVFRLPVGSETWQPLVAGLTGAVHDLAALPGSLLAATDQGLLLSMLSPEAFIDSQSPSAKKPAKNILSDFSHEPDMSQVREVAIRYAEVHPDKIRRWRRQAAWKALLPSFNMGYDHDTSRDVHYDEGSFPSFQIIETRDRSYGMDFSLTWDLDELIWNNDQTSIDTRSKLMVELRDDIVNEVTRIYFERRRLQAALLSAPPVDQKAAVEKELRIQELSALLDGLTGGYFSAHITSPQTQ